MTNPNWPHPAHFDDFGYSKLSHFELFRDLPFQSYNIGNPDPAICDLKVYQDCLAFCFIRRNIPPGSRILEVGGGDSRLLKAFSTEHECWCVDKSEGLGNGPIEFSSSHFRTVYDYMGKFNRTLPDSYFDLVFSISALEHTFEVPTIRESIAPDIDRVLKLGGLSFHCFDIIARTPGKHWVNGLIPHFYKARNILNPMKSMEQIVADPDTFYMSEAAYNASWKPIVKLSYEENGRPLSYNILWRKH